MCGGVVGPTNPQYVRDHEREVERDKHIPNNEDVCRYCGAQQCNHRSYEPTKK